MKRTSTTRLYLQLVRGRNKLTALVDQYGLQHPLVLRCSQSLDKVALKLQRRMAV